MKSAVQTFANPELKNIYENMVNEIKFMCTNMCYAYADPNKSNFLELLKWFIELKQEQLSKGYCLHSFTNCNCVDRQSCHLVNNENVSIYSLKVIDNPLFNRKIMSLIFKTPY